MGAPAAPAAAPAAPKAPKTALEKDMDKINRANRALQRQVSDATKNDASLALLVTIHDAAVAAKDETPAFAADQADADRAKFLSDYKSKMDEFIASVDKVTADLKAGACLAQAGGMSLADPRSGLDIALRLLSRWRALPPRGRRRSWSLHRLTGSSTPGDDGIGEDAIEE